MEGNNPAKATLPSSSNNYNKGSSSVDPQLNNNPHNRNRTELRHTFPSEDSRKDKKTSVSSMVGKHDPSAQTNHPSPDSKPNALVGLPSRLASSFSSSSTSSSSSSLFGSGGGKSNSTTLPHHQTSSSSSTDGCSNLVHTKEISISSNKATPSTSTNSSNSLKSKLMMKMEKQHQIKQDNNTLRQDHKNKININPTMSATTTSTSKTDNEPSFPNKPFSLMKYKHRHSSFSSSSSSKPPSQSISASSSKNTTTTSTDPHRSTPSLPQPILGSSASTPSNSESKSTSAPTSHNKKSLSSNPKLTWENHDSVGVKQSSKYDIKPSHSSVSGATTHHSSNPRKMHDARMANITLSSSVSQQLSTAPTTSSYSSKPTPLSVQSLDSQRDGKVDDHHKVKKNHDDHKSTIKQQPSSETKNINVSSNTNPSKSSNFTKTSKPKHSHETMERSSIKKSSSSNNSNAKSSNSSSSLLDTKHSLSSSTKKTTSPSTSFTSKAMAAKDTNSNTNTTNSNPAKSFLSHKKNIKHSSIMSSSSSTHGLNPTTSKKDHSDTNHSKSTGGSSGKKEREGSGIVSNSFTTNSSNTENNNNSSYNEDRVNHNNGHSDSGGTNTSSINNNSNNNNGAGHTGGGSRNSHSRSYSHHDSNNSNNNISSIGIQSIGIGSKHGISAKLTNNSPTPTTSTTGTMIGGGISGLPSGAMTTNTAGSMNTTTTSHREVTTSFLETLTEEEKRTRTRHLPDVEGFRRLHKSEIKSDLKVARSHYSFQPELFSKQLVKLDKKGEFASLDHHYNTNCSKSTAMNPKPLIDIIPDDEDYYNAEVSSSAVSNDNCGEKGGLVKILNPFVAPEGVSKSSFRPSSIGNKDTTSTTTSDIDLEPISSIITPNNSKHHQQQQQQQQTPIISRSDSANTSSNTSLLPENGFPISFKSPKTIESITAFNPPRPPESIGPKKKNRLLRWERSPQDVEIDLGNYQKTVEHTQKELHSAEQERERVETSGSILRDHFMHHLRLMREESVVINQEFQSLQMECQMLADSMSEGDEGQRRRGGDKNTGGSTSMLNVLSSVANDILPIHVDTNASKRNFLSENFSGIGGVSFVNDEKPSSERMFMKSMDSSIPMAAGWILPGDKVTTPYGKGIVLDVYGVSLHDSEIQTPNPPVNKIMKRKHLLGKKKFKMGAAAKSAFSKSDTSKASKKDPLSRILAPRIRVRLMYGIGYFCPNLVSVTTSPVMCSEAEVLSRWKNMKETAFLMKDCLDSHAMKDKYLQGLIGGSDRIKKSSKIRSNEKSKHFSSPEGEDKYIGHYDNQKTTGEHEHTDNNRDGLSDNGNVRSSNNADDHIDLEDKPFGQQKSQHKRVVPFGDGLISASGWSSAALTKISVQDLEAAIQPMLPNRDGVLGRKSNKILNGEMRYWEDQRFDLFQLKGHVLQLRNELCRQEKARKLNERSRTAAEERMRKVENLFVEMKADLNSLKERLREELSELGIDQEKAEEILAIYSRELNDVVTDDENSLPQKRGKDSDSMSTGTSSRNTRRKVENISVTKTIPSRDDDMMEVSYG